MVDRFGACICLCFSPSSGNSCSGASRAPAALISTALVPDTFCGAGLGDGSLGCILTSPEDRHDVVVKVRVDGCTIRLAADAAQALAGEIIVMGFLELDLVLD